MKELTDAAWQVIREFTTEGPSPDHLAGVRAALDRDLETGFQENIDLLNEMMTSVENGEDVAGVFNPRALYGQLTTSALRQAARDYLDLKRYVQVTLRPESK